MDKLRAETEDPFVKPRVFLFGFLAVSAFTGFLFILPRLIGSLAGAPNAAPVSSVVQDLVTNAVALVVCGGIAYVDSSNEKRREQAKEEGALVARVKVLPQADSERGKGTVTLSDFRTGRTKQARRPVLCLGDADYCMKCLDTSSSVATAMESSDFLVVPVLTGEYGLGQSEALEKAAKGVPYVALPEPGRNREEQQAWADFIELQQNQARDQGVDFEQGLVVIVKKNGRIGLRALGYPDWGAMTGDVAARVGAGMDTINM